MTIATPPAKSAAWPEQRIENWAELQNAFDQLTATCVYRGQSSQRWPLRSSFNRVVPSTDERLALDWELRSILRFRSEAHGYLPPSVMPPNPFKLEALDTYLEWLMLMQHYGAPTRLLDWSQSPYVATYFAVIDRSPEDAAIWHFDSAPVEAAVCARYGKQPGDYVDYADYRAEEIRRPGDAGLLYSAMKKFRTSREVAQQGVFTFTNRLSVDHQRIIPTSCGAGACGRVVIPNALKAECCYRLGLMNVNAASLFPGVEGVCASIRDALRLAADTLPGGQS